MRGPARHERSGFNAVLDHARPDLWELAISSMHGDYETTIPWPDTKGAALEELFTAAAIPPGTYRVEARRIHDEATPDGTIKSAKTRMRRIGPLSTVYEHGAYNALPVTLPDLAPVANGVAMNGSPRARAAATPTLAIGPDPEISELNRQRQRDLAEAAAINARRNLERAQRDGEPTAQGRAAPNDVAALRYELLRELDRIRSEQSRPNAMVPIFSALTPILTACVTTMMQAAQRRDELLMQMFGQQAAPASSGGGIDVMAGVLPLIRQVIQLGQELGGGGEERGMLGDVASIVGVLGRLRDGAPVDASTPQPPTVQQPRRLPTAEEAVQLRVLQWLAAVQEYLQGDADPYSAADTLAPQLGLLPRKFRELLTTGNSLESVLSGLVSWMPVQLHERLAAHVRSTDAARTWLTQFLDGLQDDGEDDEADEWLPEPVHGGSTAADGDS